MRRVLPPPVTPQPLETIRTATEWCGESAANALADLPAPARFPPRSVEAIVDSLTRGDAEHVTLMEWVLLVREKPDWDRRHASRIEPVREAVWNAAAKSVPVYNLLTWRLALRLMDLADFPRTLDPRHPPSAPRGAARRWSTMMLLLGTSNDPFLDAIWRVGDDPAFALRNADLPEWGARAKSLREQSVRLFIERGAPRIATEWLVRCLDSMAPDGQATAVTSLLFELDPSLVGENHPELVAWVSTAFDRRTAPSMWQRLSDPARRILRDWMGAVIFRDFEHLVRQMLEPWNEQKLGMRVHNNAYKLASRQVFWGRYRSQFRRIRILLPQRTWTHLGDQLEGLRSGEVAALEPDESKPNEQTEVCIFEFDDWIIAQEFRGPGSGARLFRSTKETTKLLFDNPISLMGLRALLRTRVLDHVGAWEHRAAESLSRLGIHEDPGHPPLERKALNPRTLEGWLEARQKRERDAQRWMNGVSRPHAGRRTSRITPVVRRRRGPARRDR